MPGELVSLGIEDGVATVRMQDEQGRNALAPAFVAELRSALASVAENAGAKVLLLTGLPDVFCSGAPLELLRALCDETVKPSELDLPLQLLSLPLPIVAAMRGHALGGGLAVGLCADVVVFGRESRYGANFMEMGFTPGMGMTGLLEHVLPPASAHEMLYTGGSYRGSFFEKQGAGRVVAREQVESEALDIARRIAEKPRHALELLKRALAKPRRERYERDFRVEARMHEICFRHPETIERIEANYVE